jgi:ribosomal protein L16 Arg81 hydroxylase
LFNSAFNAKESPKYQENEVEVTNALLRRLLDTSDAFMAHFRQYVTAPRQQLTISHAGWRANS